LRVAKTGFALVALLGVPVHDRTSVKLAQINHAVPPGGSRAYIL
jgi:hypothetical protein